jgi:hypothetical protein
MPFKFNGMLLGLTTRKPISKLGFILPPDSILNELTLTLEAFQNWGKASAR